MFCAYEFNDIVVEYFPGAYLEGALQRHFPGSYAEAEEDTQAVFVEEVPALHPAEFLARLEIQEADLVLLLVLLELYFQPKVTANIKYFPQLLQAGYVLFLPQV